MKARSFAASILLLGLPASVHAQETDKLAAPVPGRWGAADQAGASNSQTPDKAKAAARLIKQGRTYALSRLYEAAMPRFGDRVFALTGTNGPAAGPLGRNGAYYNDDFLATQFGQVGTQLDALGHVGVNVGGEERYYGGRSARDVHGPAGLKTLGVEHVRPFFTRGVLIDIEGYKGKLPDGGTEITEDDIKGALMRENIRPDSIGEGDVVLIHTGWGRYWKTDNKRYLASAPGIGLGAARWLISRGVALIGSDTMAVEVLPNPDSTLAMPVHVEAIARNGVFLMEGVATEALKRDEIWEFAFSYAPMPVVGATGAPGNALAIR